MHVVLDIVPPMRPLIAVTVMESDVHQIRMTAIKCLELRIVVYFFRFVVHPGFYWYLYLVYEVHKAAKIYIRNRCKNIPRIWCQ